MNYAHILGLELGQYAELKRRLREELPDIDDETLIDTLEGATNLHGAIAEVVRSALIDEAFMSALRGRIPELEARMDRFEFSASRKRLVAQEAMEDADLPKILEPDFTLSLRTNPPSVVVTCEEEIPGDYKVAQPPKLDRRRLLEDLKNGRQVPGATLSNSTISLAVRTK